MIYFAVAETMGLIKIGFTKGSVRKRLSNVQSSSPDSIRILLSMHGDRLQEKSLHDRFAASHVRGEWFKPSPDLLDYIARHLTHGSEISDDKLDFRKGDIVRLTVRTVFGWKGLFKLMFVGDRRVTGMKLDGSEERVDACKHEVVLVSRDR